MHLLSFGTPFAVARGRPCTWCFPFSGAPERRRSPVGWPSSPGPPEGPPTPPREHIQAREAEEDVTGLWLGCAPNIRRDVVSHAARVSLRTKVLEARCLPPPPVAGITVTHPTPTPTRAHGGHPLPPPPPPSPIHQGCWEAVLGTVGPKSPEDLV